MSALFFDRIQESPCGAFVMLDREPFGLIHVTPSERLGDAAVLLRQLLKATRQQDADIAESLAGIVQVFQEGLEAGGVGRLD